MGENGLKTHSRGITEANRMIQVQRTIPVTNKDGSYQYDRYGNILERPARGSVTHNAVYLQNTQTEEVSLQSAKAARMLLNTNYTEGGEPLYKVMKDEAGKALLEKQKRGAIETQETDREFFARMLSAQDGEENPIEEVQDDATGDPDNAGGTFGAGSDISQHLTISRPDRRTVSRNRATK
jgi:hypothetical protein